MKAWLIGRRELAAWLDQPVAYAFVVGFLLLAGTWLFVLDPVFVNGRATVRALFDLLPLLLVFFAPALTMRLLAEERRSGTLEVLLTWPVGDLEVVLGKFIGALSVLTAAIALTAPYALSVSILGPLDWGPVLTGYLGIFLLGAADLALGLMVSAQTSSQIVAFVGAFLLCFGLLVLGKALPVLPTPVADVAANFAVELRVERFARGVLDSRDIIFFLLLAAAGLWIAAESLRARRWR